MKKIVLTGGGTAGHVMPNLALLPGLKNLGYDILYIGTYAGIERELAADAGLAYSGISSGKLRRYFDLQNFTDPFRVVRGYLEAKKLLRDFAPDVVFSKGGFVAVPVTLAADALHIRVVEHESDMTPGLANRISARAATRICVSFPETLDLVPERKGVLTGLPVREELLRGDRQRGLHLIGASGGKPVLMVIGGSLGAESINAAVREALPKLLEVFDICHVTGRGKLNDEYMELPGYQQFEFIGEELSDIYAAADVMISRAGANVIHEILALKKPALLIPLPATSSRGDQILNAESFEKRGYSYTLREEDMSSERLVGMILRTYEEREALIQAMSESPFLNGVGPVLSVIEEVAAALQAP